MCKIIFITSAVAVMLTSSSSSWGKESKDVPYQSLPPGTSVDVGGYRLHFKVTSGRKPTVLLEAGGGLDSSSWDAVQEPLARATGSRVISYDRAGLGSSDAATYGSYDIVKEVTALHRGLEKLGLTDNLILVGMSYGAFLVQERIKGSGLHI